MKRVSVIVPAYNAGATLERCLASIAGQTRAAHEVIVVDDCSSDSSASLAGRFGVKLLRHEKRLGAGAARDTGARAAAGDILAFLDADCVAPSDWIGQIAGYFESDRDLCGVGGLYEYERGSGVVGILCHMEGEFSDSARSNPATNYPDGGNSAFLRNVWHAARSGAELRLFEGIAGGEDSFVWNEISLYGKVKVVTSPKVVHLSSDLAGYIRRHLSRGQSGTVQIGWPGTARGPCSLRIYGGKGVVLSSAALAVFLASPLLGFWYWPAAAFTAAIALALHTATFHSFFSFTRRFYASLTPRQDAGLRLLLLVRHACWGAGAAVSLLKTASARLSSIARTARDAVHFMIPGRISRLFLFVTARCDAACPFCLNRDRHAAPGDAELGLEELRSVAKSFGRLPYLTVTGGEPFLRDDLSEIVGAFHRECGTTWVTVTTNGIRSGAIIAQVSRMLSDLPNLLLTIQVSLDYPDETHDSWRRAPGAFESVGRTLHALGRLRGVYRRLRVQVATVYCGENAGRARDTVEYCRRNFSYDQHVFSLFRKPGERWTDETNHLVPGLLEAMRLGNTSDRPARGLWHLVVETVADRTTSDTARAKPGHTYLYPCRAGNKFMTIYENGDAAACEIRGDVSLGNVRRFGCDAGKLLRMPEARDMVRSSIRRARCACEWPCAAQFNALLSIRSVYHMVVHLLRRATRTVGR